MRAPNAILIACLQPWPNRGQRACDRQRSILQQPQRTVGCNCGYESNLWHESNLSLDYVMHLGYKIGQPRSLRACSRDDPECGARRGVLRRRLVTAGPGRPGKSPARHYDLAARNSLHGSGGNAGDGSAVPRPKTATVERREASVPRHGTQGASLGAWRAASCARLTGVPPSTRTFLGAPPTPRFGVSEARMQTPGAKTCRGNEMGCLTS